MRLLVTTLAAMVAAALGAMVSLYVGMWFGGLISDHEPGAYAGLVVALFAAPVGALAAGWMASVLVWRAYGRSLPSA